jgi:hypothetical protein
MSWKCVNCEHFNEDSFERCDVCNFGKKDSLEFKYKPRTASEPKIEVKPKSKEASSPKSTHSPSLRIHLGRGRKSSDSDSHKSTAEEIKKTPVVAKPEVRKTAPVILITLLVGVCALMSIFYIRFTSQNSETSALTNSNADFQPTVLPTLMPSVIPTVSFTPTPTNTPSSNQNNINVSNGNANLSSNSSTFISSNCSAGDYGDFTGGFFRSYAKHSVDGDNVIAIINPDAGVKVLSVVTGEPRKTTGNTMWYKVKFVSGTCQFDPRNSYDTYGCEIQNLDTGYVNADLVVNCN